jgi:hypothetical protein
MPHRLLHLLLVLTGCLGPWPNAELADLPELVVAISMSDRPTSTDDTRSELSVVLGHDTDAFADCATLGDTHASFDGQALELTEPGYYDEGSIDCVEPRFGGLVDIAAGVEHRLEISDSSHRVLATFEPRTIEPRVATPLSRTDWRLTAGETVAFRWSHVDDLALPVSAHFFLADGSGYDFKDVQVVGDEVLLALPPAHPIDDGVLELMFAKDMGAYDGGDAATCAGAVACSWRQRRAMMHDATIDP